MPTWTALTHLQGREAAEGLAEACEDLDPEPVGTGVFEIEDGSDRWEVGVYFTDPPDEIALALLAAAHAAQPFAISELPEVDWVAHVRRELTPVEAGRFFVHGAHDADRVPEGSEALLIEAAMAFGTGHHDTTRGCLLALDRMIGDGETPERVADIGCGTAVLAMAAARVLPGVVLASDIDPVAVETAQANVIANGLAGRVECVMAEGFGHPLLHDARPYDLVFANILKQPLIELAPDMARHLAPGGKAILSGILVGQAEEVAAAYAEAGVPLQRRDDLGEWATLVVGRPAEG
ncbi:50S ribosomal protein L11 methyltransferase [Paracoccus sp. MC1862]|uniref:50S ribosomal protein L11 methyltransferase n=1 Tax=Paracoccus sp. MC1862 TaxID=2760307 RepID=UPI0016006331|nr:50S ribosomal protein L11 methyltransferase [Paracoccus sp. MC1862]MBB1497617.1 50S ribosomal protein L11 methyltransferase [Paracoccus sp. MC1862]QQO44062.1 50S ribosomal protein L11 methyltransferase [Paracoccus sp. MC1862]